MFLKGVWMSFVSLFIPAILHFEMGISLAGVFLYAMLHSIVSLLLIMFVSWPYVSRHGTKLAMLIWVLGMIWNILILMFAMDTHWLVFLAPLFGWVHVAFFRIWFHMNMSMNASKEDTLWRTNAFIDSAITIAFIIGPLLGWFIADRLGESVLFSSSVVFILISMVPLLASWKEHKSVQFSPQKEFTFIREHMEDVIRIWKSFAGQAYVQFIWSMLWSITLFGFFKSYTKLWLLSTITGLAVVVFITILGKKSDKNPEQAKKRLKVSTGIQWVNWLVAWIALAAWFFGNILFMAIDTFHKITYKINSTYMNKIFYEINDKTAQENPLYGVIIHELAIHGAKIVFCLIGALTFWIVGDSISYISVLYAIVILVVPLQLVLISTSKKSNI